MHNFHGAKAGSLFKVCAEAILGQKSQVKYNILKCGYWSDSWAFTLGLEKCLRFFSTRSIWSLVCTIFMKTKFGCLLTLCVKAILGQPSQVKNNVLKLGYCSDSWVFTLGLQKCLRISSITSIEPLVCTIFMRPKVNCLF